MTASNPLAPALHALDLAHRLCFAPDMPFQHRVATHEALELAVVQMIYPSSEEEGGGGNGGTGGDGDDFLTALIRCLVYLATEAQRRGETAVAKELNACIARIQRLIQAKH